MHEHIYIIGIGSNLPDADMRLEEALRALMAADIRVRASRGMTTAPVDFPNPAPFVNLVAEARCTLTTEQLQSKLKLLEAKAGRKPHDKALGRVVIDMDILACDGHVLRPSDWERRYIQVLLREIGL